MYKLNNNRYEDRYSLRSKSDVLGALTDKRLRSVRVAGQSLKNLFPSFGNYL